MNIKKARTDDPILMALAERWSPYGFEDCPMSGADIRSLFETARRAASSYNEQSWNYLVGSRLSTFLISFGMLLTLPLNFGAI
jgi:hypothetical protein